MEPEGVEIELAYTGQLARTYLVYRSLPLPFINCHQEAVQDCREGKGLYQHHKIVSKRNERITY